MPTRGITRRQLVKGSTAAAGVLLARGSSPALGALGANEKLTLGFIGTGGQALAHIHDLVKMPDARIAAVCDVDSSRREHAAQAAGSSPEKYGDFRKLLDRKDLDAVVVVTPDHWHAIPVILALQAGKHVYFEKPCAHNIREGRAMAEAAKRSGKIALIGTQQRSGKHWQSAVAKIQSGDIGRITTVHAWNAWNREEMFADLGNPKETDPPAGVDYDMWLGPAPRRDFNPARFHGSWYFFWDYSGNMISGWGVHLFDIVLWAMGPEIKSVSTAGGNYVFKDCRQSPDTAEAVFDCPGYTLTYSVRHGNGWRPHGDMDHGIEFFGDKGTLQINRNGYQVFREEDRGSRKPAYQEGVAENSLFEHKRHFFDCIRTGSKPRCDAETGHLSSIPGHLANISYRVGRKVTWDSKTEAIADDPEASRLLGREYRSPWALPTLT